MTRQIMFSHRRALGDALMFTCGVRDFKLLFPDIQINVDTNFPEVFENNPYLSRKVLKKAKSIEYYKVGYPMINNSNATHFTKAFLYDMIAVVDGHEPLGMPIGMFCSLFANGDAGDPSYANVEKNDEAKEPFISRRTRYKNFSQKFNKRWADIHLTPTERSTNLIKDVYDVDKYWIVAPGGKTDCTCKVWDWRKFQDVVDYYEGMIKFVVIGKSDHIVEKLDNVIDLTDKFNDDIRGLFPLVYHSEGCVSGISFLMHLAAATPPKINKERKPCVAIMGGREPSTFTGYTDHQILHTNGIFTCCDNGGCWQSRVAPLSHVKESGNKRLCEHPMGVDGKFVAECMSTITSQDVIRAIGKYYEGDIYTYNKKQANKEKSENEKNHIDISDNVSLGKEINLLASMSSAGGGEQSAQKIYETLVEAGWIVNFYPWDSVHKNYEDRFGDNPKTFKNYGIIEDINVSDKKIPLLFYANDQINPFLEEGHELVEKSSSVIIGINYVNGKLPTSTWLHQTGKLKAVIFQNEEKRDEFERDRFGFDDTKQIVLFGAVDLDKYLNIYTAPRENKELVILKHCTPDYRKYVTKESEGKGKKIHVWQKNIIKENDIKFYTRLLKDTKETKFMFMKAHKEIEEHFRGESRMKFYDWNEISVEDFLQQGHVYLYRTSNLWRDQYPRVVAEALAAGLPVLSEPRDGTKDRIDYGNSGFYCIDYDAFLYGVRILQRKEKLRQEMGKYARNWAKDNLDPKRWITTLEEVLNGSATS